MNENSLIYKTKKKNLHNKNLNDINLQGNKKFLFYNSQLKLK